MEDIDYIGVASIDHFEAPSSYKPNDVLESCKSIISLGIGIGNGVKITNQQAYIRFRHGIYVYMNSSYIILNSKLDLAALRISRF